MSDLIQGKFNEALGIVVHRREEVIITRYGKPVARLVPLEEFKLATDLMANRSMAPVPIGGIPTAKRKKS